MRSSWVIGVHCGLSARATEDSDATSSAHHNHVDIALQGEELSQ